MDACPSCRRAVVGARGACPHCGAMLCEEGTLAPDAGPPSSVGASAELPDLVIAPAARPAPAPASNAGSAPKPLVSDAAALPDLGANRDFDDDDDFDVAQIEIVGHERGKRPLPPPPVATSIAPTTAQRPAASVAAAPTELDRYDVLAFADYGRAPRHPWESPAYALRVLFRQRQLRRSLSRVRGELRRCEAAQSDALVALFERTRPMLASHDDGARLLAPIGEIEDRARARGEALESTSAEFEAKVAGLDREIGALDEARTAEMAKQAKLAEVVERAADELSRAEAKQRRVDIEIRATQQAARAAAGPDATVAPPEFAVKLSALAEERDARVAEVARARALLDEANGPFAEQQRVVVGYERRLADLRKSRKVLEEGYERQISVRSEGLSEVEKERRDAIADVARRLLANSRVPLDEKGRAAVAAADEAKRRGDEQLDKHLRALDAFDKKRFKEGAAIVACGVALLLLVLLLLGGMVRGEPG